MSIVDAGFDSILADDLFQGTQAACGAHLLKGPAGRLGSAGLQPVQLADAGFCSDYLDNLRICCYSQSE
jgi:hypothetical protein